MAKWLVQLSILASFALPAAAEPAPPVFGGLAVIVDSPFETRTDSAGKRVAHSPKTVFVAAAVPMAALRTAGNMAYEDIRRAYPKAPG